MHSVFMMAGYQQVNGKSGGLQPFLDPGNDLHGYRSPGAWIRDQYQFHGLAPLY
jgi:hypothetical protein